MQNWLCVTVCPMIYHNVSGGFHKLMCSGPGYECIIRLVALCLPNVGLLGTCRTWTCMYICQFKVLEVISSINSSKPFIRFRKFGTALFTAIMSVSF